MVNDGDGMMLWWGLQGAGKVRCGMHDHVEWGLGGWRIIHTTILARMYPTKCVHSVRIGRGASHQSNAK